MFCPKCGTQNEDNAQFCHSCGAPFAPKTRAQTEQPQPVQQTPAAAEQPQPVWQTPAAAAQPDSGTVHRLQKHLAHSPLFLIAVIAYTVSLVIEYIVNVSGSGILAGYLTQIMRGMQMPASSASELFRILGIAGGGNPIVALIPMVLPILIAVGLWMVFAAGLSRRQENLSTGGMTMIKVILIIMLVVLCIGLVLILLGVFAAGSILGSAGYYSSDWTKGFTVTVILILAVMALFVLYYVFAIRTLGVMKRTAVQGVVRGNVSAYVAVISILAGLYHLIMIGVAVPSGYLLPVLQHLCGAAYSFCFAIFLFVYRSRMNALKYVARQ